MRVLLTSTSYPSDAHDWRGRFITDMAGALAKKNEMNLEIWAPPGILPPDVSYAATDVEAIWLK